MPRLKDNNLNRLWIARKKTGLGQKGIARLLGHRSASVISEYEAGRLIPNLRTALKLSVIYNTPLPELYKQLYSEVLGEVEVARKQWPSCAAIAFDQQTCIWTPPNTNQNGFSQSIPAFNTSGPRSLKGRS